MGTSSPMTEQLNRSGRILLVTLFVIAALLRVYGIFDRGVLLWDEGSYLMEGRFIATGVKAAAWQLAVKLPWVPAPDGEQLHTRITEAMTRYECDGKVGIGMSEFLDQVVDGWPIGVPAFSGT